MALHRKGKLLAGALFAGALFGQEEEYIFSGTGRLVETEQVRPVQFITPNFAADDNQNYADVVTTKTTNSTQEATQSPLQPVTTIAKADTPPELLAIQISQEITLIQQIKSDEEALLMMLLEL